MHLLLSDRSLVIDLERGQFWELLLPHFEIVVPDVLWERHFDQEEKKGLLHAGLNVLELSDAEVRLATNYLRQLQSKGISAADAFALVLTQTFDGTLLTHNHHLYTFAQGKAISTQTLRDLVEYLITDKGVLAHALYQKFSLVCQYKHCGLYCRELLSWLSLQLPTN